MERHIHRPDMGTVTVNRVGDALYLDVACSDPDCGITGCLGELVQDEADGIIRFVANDGQVLLMAGFDAFDEFTDETSVA